MTKRIIIPLLAAFVLIISSSRAFAWFDEGHMVIAKIAWDQMTDAEHKQLIDILDQLPSKDKTLLPANPADVPADKRDLYMFMKAATWPDQIRSGDIVPQDEMHKTWHYIDIPYNLDGRQGPVPTTQWSPEAGEQGVENAVQALQYYQWVLSRPGGPTPQKATALCWYLHLVGDIHQPLHATSLFSNAYPDGDAGGNRIHIKLSADRESMRLHALWDGLLGAAHDPPAAERREEELMKDQSLYGPDVFKGEIDRTYYQWAQESFELAKTDAYLNGDLKALAHPSQEYLKNANKVGQHRVALAGYRLAARLKQILPLSAAPAATQP